MVGDNDWTVRALRRRWKPRKEQLKGDLRHEATLIRIHRALSWMHRAESIADGDALDDKLIFQWIAFNALYGQWDQEEREPMRDRGSWKAFLQRVIDLDADRSIATVLLDHRKLVLSIYEDEFLSSHFWEDPHEDGKMRIAMQSYSEAPRWYQRKDFAVILKRLVDRVYLMRCQLVHGAATREGRLNRRPLRRCTSMMDRLMPAIVLVLIDHGWAADWGALCYPPIR